MSIIDKALVKRPRLTQRQRRVVSGRSCWCLEFFAGHATSKGKIENEERSPRI